MMKMVLKKMNKKEIKVRKYDNHAEMYPENYHTEKEIYELYISLCNEYKNKGWLPINIYYRCPKCNKYDCKHSNISYNNMLGKSGYMR